MHTMSISSCSYGTIVFTIESSRQSHTERITLLSIILHPMSFDNFHYHKFLYIRLAAEMLILEQYF